MAASPLFPKKPSSWSEELMPIQNGELSLRLWRKTNASLERFLFLVHGQGEQSDRYEHFCFYLEQEIDAIICLDLPGHGLSKGIRGHIESFDHYSEALLVGFSEAQKWISQNSKNPLIHWFGHSLGGLLSLRTLLAHPNLPIQSVIISAPLLGLALPVPPVKEFFANLFEPLIAKVKLSNELDGGLVSHDSSVASEYSQNPLNHQYITPRFFKNLMKEMPLTQTHRGPFGYSVMMIVPLADRIVSAPKAMEFYANLQLTTGKIKKLNTFAGYFHEGFNDLGKERVFNAISFWLKENSNSIKPL